MEKLKVASFFAGVGGIDLGFENTKHFKTVYANEFDPYPAEIFDSNFITKIDLKDIHNVSPTDLPDINCIIGGFPCTSFSIAGYQKGFEDERTGDLFFELARLIKAKRPEIIFLENVKNLVSHDNGKTFKIILDCLESMGYHIKYQVLNAAQYGNVPHGRERIYIVGFLDIEAYYHFEFPKPITLTKQLSDLIDFEKKQPAKYYYTKEKCTFYDTLTEQITKQHTIYQWRRKYVRENKSNLCPTLTANMGTGGHNVPLILTPYGIRKLTPRESFNLQGFPLSFILPTTISDGRLYKCAGNSVVVSVIQRIAENIFQANKFNKSK